MYVSMYVYVCTYLLYVRIRAHAKSTTESSVVGQFVRSFNVLVSHAVRIYSQWLVTQDIRNPAKGDN